jgi:hypothetical protein
MTKARKKLIVEAHFFADRLFPPLYKVERGWPREARSGVSQLILHGVSRLGDSQERLS